MIRNRAAIRSAIGILLGGCWLTPGSVLAAGVCAGAGANPSHAFDIPIAGIETSSRTVDVPSGTALLISAAESSVDVWLEIGDGRSSSRISDSPLRRLGPQRLLLEPGAARTITVTLSGKEITQAQGSVRLEIAPLAPKSAPPECAAAVRLLAAGDENYARGQRVSLGLMQAPAGSAQRDYAEAVGNYQRAAKALNALDDPSLLGSAHLAAASTLYQGSQDWRGAQTAADLAFTSFTASHDDYRAARARAMSSAAGMELALEGRTRADTSGRDPEQMLSAVRSAFLDLAEQYTRRGEHYDAALALNNAGLAFYYAGMFDEAIRTYRRAAPIYSRLRERGREAQVLQNVAITQYELGRFANARQTFTRVLELIRESDGPKLYADVLNNLALGEADVGEFDRALNHYSTALRILTKLQFVREQARSLQGIGAVYYAVGSRSQAIEYFSRALEIRTVAVDPRGRLGTLRSIANALSDSGRWKEALARREEALTLATSPLQRARILVEIGSDTAATGNSDAALKIVEQALTAAPDSNTIVAGRALVERAKLRYMRSEYDAAARDAAAAARIFQTHEMPGAVFGTQLLAARIAHANGNAELASAETDRAIKLAEHVRTLSANPELRASLWHPLRPAFDLKIELLREQQADPKANALATLAVAEQSRDRALADFRERALAGPTTHSPAIESRKHELYGEIAARRLQLESRLERTGKEDALVKAMRADIVELTRELDIANSAADSRARTEAVSPGSPDSLRAAIASVPKGTAVVEYWLGEQAAYAWTVADRAVTLTKLGPPAQIERVARQFYDVLDNSSTIPQTERLRLAQELYTLIIAPLPRETLRARTLLFVPDGALHYVPFAALTANARSPRFLIDDHDIARGSSLSALMTAREASKPKGARSILVVSDPVYSRDDQRLNTPERTVTADPYAELKSLAFLRGDNAGKSWVRLRGSGREAQAISALFPAGAVDGLSGITATRDQVLSRDLSSYRFLHFATHGVANVEAPQLSALVLSTVDASGRPIPGEVFAGDFLQRRLTADLVVLSACETALGKETAGEGLLGLRYVAHASGARAVVASLWAVPDRVGADVMSSFYAGIIRKGKPATEALADAMRAERHLLPDPAFWAPFEVSLMGRDAAIH